MKILAHRGYWETQGEKNTIVAFERAFAFGFGVETDIRDYNGDIVISHDPPKDGTISLENFLNVYRKYMSSSSAENMLALNVKSDGLYTLLAENFKRAGLSDNHYYFFDMSVPEQYQYISRGFRTYSRSSEFEKELLFPEKMVGVWLDQFEECDHIEKELPRLLGLNIPITIISPELHGRDKTKVWELLKEYRNCEQISLCTDLPMEAREYFNEK